MTPLTLHPLRLPSARSARFGTSSPLMLSVVLAVAGCGDVGISSEQPSDEELAEIEAAIQGGAGNAVERQGNLALEFWSNESNAYVAYCSAVLMANRSALTAKHCTVGEVDPATRAVYAHMGTQRVQITEVIPNPSWDVAVIRFAAPMAMPNWNRTRFLTSPPQVNTRDYVRALYSGTNASLKGARLTCIGYGPGVANALPTFATFTADYDVYTWGTVWLRQSTADPAGALPVGGDSGMGCGVNYLWLSSPLAYVHSGHTGSVSHGTGAASLTGWFGY